MPLSLYDEFFRIVGALNEHQVPYAVCGGMAVSLYIKPRATQDIDILLCAADVEKLRPVMEPLGYHVWAPPWTFRDSKLTLHRFIKIFGEEMLVVDVLAGDEPKYQRMVAAAFVAESERGPVRLVQRPDLITLKQARNSLQDQTDIAALQHDENRTNSPRSERPPGFFPADGTGAPANPTQRSPAKRPKKTPAQKRPRSNRPRKA